LVADAQGKGMIKKTLSSADLAPHLTVVVGTRPGIVMFSPIIADLQERGADFSIVHSGQHYSDNMDTTFFRELHLPQPTYRVADVEKSPTHAGQTAAMMVGIETYLFERRPCLVLVGGDANTNLAAALAAAKLNIPIGHVEAGERSFDRRMPEEQNRIVIDHLSEYLYATDENSVRNLEREGLRGGIVTTGNPIVDASLRNITFAQPVDRLSEITGPSGRYAVMTLHREENADCKPRLRSVLEGASRVAQMIGAPVIFFIHPRTRKRMTEFGMGCWVASLEGVTMLDAVGYMQFIGTLRNAVLCLTDSGGVQQEACIHHVPCVTLRDNTEWQCTIDLGANRLAGCKPASIVAAAGQALIAPTDWPIPFGGQGSSKRIAEHAMFHIARWSG